ncbi:MAG TPA: hypothetical protein ENN43_03395 [bacterium]|nr:hypothetical protein [bacterium]
MARVKKAKKRNPVPAAKQAFKRKTDVKKNKRIKTVESGTDFVTKRELVFVIVMVFFVLVLRTLSADTPLDRNEAVYACAAETINNGGVLYRDVFDHKPPFIHYIYSMAFKIGGTADTAVRNMAAGFFAAAMILFYMLARAIAKSRITAAFALVVYAVFFHSPVHGGFLAETELFSQFFIFLALLFVIETERGYEHATGFLAGFFLAAAFYTSYLTAPLTIAFVVYLVYFSGRKKRMKETAWLVAGFAFMALLVTAHAAYKGMLGSFVEANLAYNIYFLAQRMELEFFNVFAENTKYFVFSYMLPAAGVMYCLYREVKAKKRTGFVIVILCFVSLFAIIAAVKAGSPRYFLLLVPFMALMSGVMLSDLYRFISSRKTGKAAAVFVLAALAAAGTVVFYKTAGYSYMIKNRTFAGAEAHEAKSMGLYIKGLKKEGDELFCWPNEPAVYFYSGCRPGTRFLNSHPYGYFINSFSEAVMELENYPPVFFVKKQGVDDSFFSAIIGKNYSIAASGKRLALYKRTERLIREAQ